jgi:hypothetical protein
MPMTYPALKSELLNDPQTYGYAAMIAAQNWNGVAAALNLLRDGTNGGPAITVRKTDISPKEVLEVIDTRDFVAGTPTIASNLAMAWFESVTQGDSMRLINDDGTDTRILGNIHDRLLVAGGQNSRSRLRALANRNGSRAEELWGRDTRVTDGDVETALRLA